MEIKFYEHNKLLVFKINEEIDECSVKEIRRRADYEIERFMPREIVFDFDKVTFMDSAGIGMVIGRYKHVGIIGGRTMLANLTDGVRKIFEMSGIFKIIPEVNLESRIEESMLDNEKEVLINE